jgi:hypothetical protein
MLQFFPDGAVVIVGSGIGAFIGAYLKKKGENYATKEDITILVEQVAAVTTATKKIESSITHEYHRWEIKKEVLFELLEKYGLLDDALNRLIASSAASILAPEEQRGSLSDPNQMAAAFTNAQREFIVVTMKVRVTCKSELTNHVVKTGSMISEAASLAANGKFQEAQRGFDEMRGGLRKLNDLVAEELDSMPIN